MNLLTSYYPYAIYTRDIYRRALKTLDLTKHVYPGRGNLYHPDYEFVLNASTYTAFTVHEFLCMFGDLEKSKFLMYEKDGEMPKPLPEYKSYTGMG